MNLTIDIGNSFAKVALINKGDLVDMRRVSRLSRVAIVELLEANGLERVDGAIVCSLKDVEADVEHTLKRLSNSYLRFNSNTHVPLKNLYHTPQTLGVDRMAAAVGAATLMPERDLLVVDFGTAITIDVVTSKGEFLGGNISPGAATRFRALNTFTESLPLLRLDECAQNSSETSIGKSTAEAIEMGVINGIVFEIEGYIRKFSLQYGEIGIIFTGGDGKFFAKRFKNTIFATCDLVMYGLNRIMDYNA